jgi:hypothetical protein
VDQQSYPERGIHHNSVARFHETLLSRLERREIGPGMEDQVRRTLMQADHIATIGGTGAIELKTDGKTPLEIAAELLHQIGWLTNRF